MSADSARWFRTGRREVEAHRDGIDVDTAGLSPLMAAAAKMHARSGRGDRRQYWLDMTRDVQTMAPVLGIILVRDRLEMGSAIAAGRAWQRLHLAATTMGLAAQPLNQPVECVDRNAELGRNDEFGTRCRASRTRRAGRRRSCSGWAMRSARAALAATAVECGVGE